MQNHPRRAERNLDRAMMPRIPRRKMINIFLLEVMPILIAKDVFQQNLDAERQSVNMTDALLGQFAQAVDDGFAIAGIKYAAGAEVVIHRLFLVF